MEPSTWELASPPVLRKPPSAPTAISLPAPTQAGPMAGLRLVASAQKASASDLLAVLRDVARGRVRLAANMLNRGNDRSGSTRSAPSAPQAAGPPIAGNHRSFHHPARRDCT